MKGKLTLTQIRVILLLAAIFMIVLTYFLIFQRNMDLASEYDTKTEKEIERFEYLTSLESTVADLDTYTSLYTGYIEPFQKSFPVKLTQQKCLSLIYRMKLDTGIDVESVTAGNVVPFYYKGKVLTSDGDQSQAQKEAAEAEPMSEIVTVELEEMIGSEANYTINVAGSTKEIYAALDWIRDNDERLSVGSVNVQFDSSTGKLKGSIGVHFYALLGNGVPYKDPEIEDKYGMENIFGEFHN